MENRTNLAVPKKKHHCWKRLFVSAAILAFSSTVFAQNSDNSCGYERDIIAYTQNLVEFSPNSEIEGARNYGAISAYLYAQYSDLSAPEQNDLYQKIYTQNLRYGAELLGAYRIFTASETDVIETIREELAKATDSINGSNFAILRAALLRGQGRYVLKSQQLRTLFVEALATPSFLSYLVADQDVETRQAIANGFERLGKIPHAVAILQTMPSLSPLLNLLQRHKDLAYVDQDIYQGTGGYSTGLEFAILNNTSLEYQNKIIPEDHLYRDPALVNLIKGEQNFRLIQVLGTVFNRTNNLDGLADFSIMLEEAIKSEGLQPDQRTFLALGAFLEYFSENDALMLEALGQLSQPYLQYDSMLALAQDQSAAFGFSAFINNTRALPPQPEFLNGDFDFAAWEATAKVIKQGDPVSIQAKFQEYPRITSELLFASDRHDLLAELLKEENTQYILPGFAEIFALRLDLQCQGYLNSPLSSMRWNIPMFRFGETPAN